MPGLGYGIDPAAAGFGEPGGLAARNGNHGRAAQALADAPLLDPYRQDLAAPARDLPARDLPAPARSEPAAGEPAEKSGHEGPATPTLPITAGPQTGQPETGLHPHQAEQAEPRASRRRRSARRRLPTQRIFSDLAGQAGIPPRAYAIGEDVDGAMCLVQTPNGFEVFNSLGGARHEVRVFSDEESAYFYLFGILAADAVRTGVLGPLS